MKAAWLAYLQAAQSDPEELALRLQLRLERLNAMREAGVRLLARDRMGRDVWPRGAPEVEAVLFAAAEPLNPDRTRAHVGEGDVDAALARLQADYAGRGITLVRRGAAWHFQTAPDLATLLRRDREEVRRLSRAGQEALATSPITSR